jgi:hypothetical protein
MSAGVGRETLISQIEESGFASDVYVQSGDRKYICRLYSRNYSSFLKISRKTFDICNESELTSFSLLRAGHFSLPSGWFFRGPQSITDSSVVQALSENRLLLSQYALGGRHKRSRFFAEVS